MGLIDFFLPFLPLERRHLRQASACASAGPPRGLPPTVPPSCAHTGMPLNMGAALSAPLCQLFAMHLAQRAETELAVRQLGGLSWGEEVVDFLTDKVRRGLTHGSCVLLAQVQGGCSAALSTHARLLCFSSRFHQVDFEGDYPVEGAKEVRFGRAAWPCLF